MNVGHAQLDFYSQQDDGPVVISNPDTCVLETCLVVGFEGVEWGHRIYAPKAVVLMNIHDIL